MELIITRDPAPCYGKYVLGFDRYHHARDGFLPSKPVRNELDFSRVLVVFALEINSIKVNAATLQQ